MINNKVLIIVLAHPDDESFAFSGLIQRAKISGCTVLLHTLTTGEAASLTPKIKSKKEMARVRKLELKQAADKLGIINFQHNLPDGKLMHKKNEVKKVIVQLLERYPNAVFTTTFHETTSHPDHKQISLILQSLQPKNLLFHFRPDRWQVRNGRQYQINLTDAESRIKKGVLLIHQSQQKDVDRYLESYTPVEYFFSEHPTEMIDELFLP